MVTLVELVFTEDSEDARETFEACRVQLGARKQVQDTSEAPFRIFQANAPHQAVDLITKRNKVFRQIAAVLPRKTCN